MQRAHPDSVRIVEVGARDGLQNEAQALSVELRCELIGRLAAAGLRHIEAGSFVSPKWVPQMQYSDRVLLQLERQPGVRYAALTPNLQGLEAALAANASEVAVFTAASDAFTQKNINCSVAQSLERIRPVLEHARTVGLPVRGYVSTVMGCPYQGEVPVQAVVDVAQALLDMGCYEISLGDTIGTGSVPQTQNLIRALALHMPVSQLAVHFHDTYGQALANIYAALELGIRTIDGSVAGLGGCPYAAGASGNVASEDVLRLVEGLGLHTGIDAQLLAETGQWISDQLQRPNGSKSGRALVAKATQK
ncbi:hydroxymethylglutaryl-CoA lyase [Thalassolituus sp. 59MF3M-4]|uniref:hydroxymethylglutaryl-CoA lyase n=2 Tax=Thalassolituus pacificus TaxID=2975440 RepID=A0A9X2WF52_9GAMM|nr:hydroxymethylglutaryl-CoA lyase [Thalassolituus pacificus]